MAFERNSIQYPEFYQNMLHNRDSWYAHWQLN